jgi:hypothetical protein
LRLPPGAHPDPDRSRQLAPLEHALSRDSEHELYVAVFSNAIHLAADIGRVITCPFIPGRLPDAAMAMIIAVEQPEGTFLLELVQWLPSAALDEPIGTIGGAALRETMAIVTALMA